MARKDNEGDQLVVISGAVELLRFLVTLVRCCDKGSIVCLIEKGGRYRYFSLAELEWVKFNRPLSISEVAQRCGVLSSVLRWLKRDVMALFFLSCAFGSAARLLNKWLLRLSGSAFAYES